MAEFDPDEFLRQRGTSTPTPAFNPDEFLRQRGPPATWTEATKTAVTNIPSSAGRFARDIVQPFIHPINTATSIANLGRGVMEKLGITSGDEHIKYADAVGQFLKDRYGSAEAIRNTLATDPVGMAADVSMVLSGGGTAAARAPGMVGRIGEIAQAAGRMTNPVSLAGKAVGKTADVVIPNIVGDFGTHTGAEAVRTAARAGYEGGPAAQAFREHMRGTADMSEVVDDARRAVQQIKRQRNADYTSGMIPVRQDATILSFNDLDTAINDMSRLRWPERPYQTPSGFRGFARPRTNLSARKSAPSVAALDAVGAFHVDLERILARQLLEARLNIAPSHMSPPAPRRHSIPLLTLLHRLLVDGACRLRRARSFRHGHFDVDQQCDETCRKQHHRQLHDVPPAC
jgi:hypothetical protein